jgi:putative tryptophan/tyrosine transport system substrate-binding protein
MMRRRTFWVMLAGAFTVLGDVAGAQTREGPFRLGILIPYAESDTKSQGHLAQLRQELAQLGWSDSRKLTLEVRWTGGDANKLAVVARELVASKPDVILVRSTAATAAVLRETRAIPIVFVVVSDPVGDGFVSSMALPGGNVTGFTNVEASLSSKWLQLLMEMDPRIKRVAILYGPKTSAGSGTYYLQLAQEAATSMGVRIIGMPVQEAREVERDIEVFAKDAGGALLITPDATTAALRSTIISATARSKLPAIYPFRDFTTEGGLVSYGTDVAEQFRKAATYVDRLLRGSKPAVLPVQAPTKFELVLNMKTANLIGLTFPPSILARADEVIE